MKDVFFAHQEREEPVKLNSGMLGTRQTTASQAVRLYPEVAAVLLRHHIGGELACTAERVFRAIDPHLLADPVTVFGPRVIPTSMEFLERELVGRIAVDLVGRHEHEHGVGAVLPRRFE